MTVTGQVPILANQLPDQLPDQLHQLLSFSAAGSVCFLSIVFRLVESTVVKYCMESE